MRGKKNSKIFEHLTKSKSYGIFSKKGMKMNKVLLCLVLLSIGIFGSGCCWVFTGPGLFDGNKQEINFNSADGTEYEIMRKGMFGSPQLIGRTGSKIPLKKTTSFFFVKNTKTGKIDIVYPERDFNHLIWLDILFPPVFIIDLATQSYRKFPETISVGGKPK